MLPLMVASGDHIDMPCTPRSGRAFGCWKERPVSGPIWRNWPFAGVMVIFALYHGVRLVTAGQGSRPNGYDIARAHLLMCTAVAAMLVMASGARHDGPRRGEV